MSSTPPVLGMRLTPDSLTHCSTRQNPKIVSAAPASVEGSRRAGRARSRPCRTAKNSGISMTIPTRRKIALIGGGGVRTPLVVFGINEAARQLGADELVLFDPDSQRVQIMAGLGKAVIAREGGSLRLRVASTIEDAVDGASFVLNSIRVGG